MKYIELVKETKPFEFVGNVKISEDQKVITIYNENNEPLLVIDNTNMFSLNTFYKGFYKLAEDQKHILIETVGKFIATPIEKRKEEKWYVIPVIPAGLRLKPKYLFKGISGLTIRDLTKEQIKAGDIDDRFIFTKKQIETMQKDSEINIDFNKSQEIPHIEKELENVF